MSKEKQKTILVVDDEVDLAELMKTRLVHEGYNVLTAYDGKQGLNIINNEDIDLVLLDIMLPKIGGIEIYKSISITKPKLPIIIITARGKLETFFEDIKATGFISKPYETTHLVNMVNGVLKPETFQLIYLIDRETEPIAKEIRKSFEEREFRVKILESLDAFKGAALDRLPNFIIMKYDQKKDMDAKDFIKKIRNILDLISKKTQPPASHVPILVYTASEIEASYGKTYYTEQCLEAGADRYVGEPRDGEMVISALRQFMLEKKSELKEEEFAKERLKRMLSTEIDRDK